MDIPAIEAHYKLNRTKLVKRMYFRTGNPAAAEDIVQSAYERAIIYIKSFREGAIFDTWLSGILNNCLRNYQDSEKGYTYRDEDEEETTEDTSCPHYSGRMMNEIYDFIRATKPPDQQEILLLNLQHQYSGTDIARITPHTYANVMNIIKRFRNELKERYKE